MTLASKLKAMGAPRWLRSASADPIPAHNPEEPMNETKFGITLAGHNAAARKVFEAVPKAEPWPVSKIANEYARLHGIALDRRVLDGCLSALAESGLIRERNGRVFICTPIRRAVKSPALCADAAIADEQPDTTPETTPETAATEVAMNMKAATPAAAVADPVTRLSELAHKLRGLADEIDSAALDAQQAIENASADSKALAQLRTLLQGI